MIKGITVTLYTRTPSGVDEFGKTIYAEAPVEVANVLVEPLTDTDIIAMESLYGKKATYRLCLPKGDAHVWEDCRVRFFNADWHVFGMGTEYIEENLPLLWNKKVLVERYG